MQSKSPERRARRIWAVGLIVAGAVAGIGVFAAVYFARNAPTAILVDGRPIAVVESRAVAKTALANARLSRAAGIPSRDLRFVRPVILRAASRNSEITDLPECVRALEAVTSVEADLFAIAVDGVPVVALRSKKDAEEALDLVKAEYERGIQNLCGKSTFKGNVFISRQFVDVGLFRDSPKSAFDALTAVAEPSTIHIVEPGDRAVYIAERYDISLDDLEAANPGVNLDRLTEGDKLVIRQEKQPITVVSRAMVTETVQITPPPGTRQSSHRTGERIMRMMVTYENGRPVAREIISQITTWDRPRVTRTHRSHRKSPKEVSAPAPETTPQ